MRALRDRPTALERWPKGVREGMQARHAQRATRGGRLLLQAAAQGRARLRRDGRDHLPVGPHRRRALPDRDRDGGLGGAHGHDHLPPVAGAPRPTSTIPTSCGSTWTPSPGTDFADAARVALVGARPARPSVGLVGFPKTSGNRGVHIYVRLEPRWDFVDVRHAAIAFGRELERRTHGRDRQLVEGGARREHLRRLQPELPRPHDRQRLLAAADHGRAGLDAGGVGRARRARPAARSTCTRCPTGWPSAATRWPAIDDQPGSLRARCSQMYADDIAGGLTDMPYPPDYPKMPGEPPRVQPSKKVASRTGTSRATASSERPTESGATCRHRRRVPRRLWTMDGSKVLTVTTCDGGSAQAGGPRRMSDRVGYHGHGRRLMVLGGRRPRCLARLGGPHGSSARQVGDVPARADGSVAEPATGMHSGVTPP